MRGIIDREVFYPHPERKSCTISRTRRHGKIGPKFLHQRQKFLFSVKTCPQLVAGVFSAPLPHIGELQPAHLGEGFYFSEVPRGRQNFATTRLQNVNYRVVEQNLFWGEDVYPDFTSAQSKECELERF